MLVGAVPIRVQISGDASKYSIPPPEARYQNIQNWGEKRDRVILLKVQCCIYIFGGAGNNLKIFCKMKSTSNKWEGQDSRLFSTTFNNRQHDVVNWVKAYK